MYMSYVLDFKIVTKALEDDQCFILATDGDVKFTHESVEALIDQMCEDSRTGAVCARTYPLEKDLSIGIRYLTMLLATGSKRFVYSC